jgi:hypothetical protein
MGITDRQLHGQGKRLLGSRSLFSHEPYVQVYIPAAVVVSTFLVQIFLWRSFDQMCKLFYAFGSAPIRLVTFLLLGRAPLSYFGHLNHFPLASIIGVAGFGGLGLSTIYLVQSYFFPTAGSKFWTAAEEYSSRQKDVKLDWALQEEMSLRLVCEIYHTVAGVVIGVLIMRLFKVSVIDHKHLDLLMTAGLFGPTISFILVISLAIIVFGVIWCLRKPYHWWCSWTTTY